ncbi:MAG: AMP-binding protein, partial [bacterium]|nr:AMP-binding protein [bacterium]
YNLPMFMQVEGRVDKKRLEDVFLKVIQRHESFRTTFELVGEEPVQRIHNPEEISFSMEERENRETMGEHDTAKEFLRPFELSQTPLLRAELLTHDATRHLLMVDMHHIISDGMSLEIFVRDFSALYSGDTLEPLKLQYKDYAEWNNSEKQEGKRKKQGEYWKKEYEDENPILELPTDYVRPVIQSHMGNRQAFEITAAETTTIKTMIQAEGATMVMALLAIYTIFLAKLGNPEDVVIGIPVSGRNHGDLGTVIGMFVNTLALRNYPEGDKTFKEFLQNVRARTLEAFENQEYPFEELVEQVVVNRDTSRNPLFDTMFVLQEMELQGIERMGMKLKPYEIGTQTTKFDLTLKGTEKDGGLYFYFEYNTQLFKKSTIKKFVTYFKNLLTGILENPGRTLAENSIITEEEKKQILREFNNTGTGKPTEAKTIVQLFEEQVARDPEKKAVEYEDQYITYSRLNREAQQLAKKLRQKGIGPDRTVALIINRSIEMVIGIM